MSIIDKLLSKELNQDLNTTENNDLELKEEDIQRPPPSYTHVSALERLKLMKYQDVLDEAKNFYKEKYGLLNSMPRDMKYSEYLFHVSPEEYTEALILLGIKFQEKKLHWVAQLYYIIQMPPFWE